MKAGKLPVELLESLVFKNIKIKNKEVISGPEIGNDCGALNINGNLLVVSSDPITAAGKGAGKLAINVNCNDIATTGLKPTAMLVTILAPVGTTEKEIGDLSSELAEEADKLGVDIIGGHTEISSAVNRIVISATAIGYGDIKRIEKTRAPKEGDYIIMTKVAGLEGTAILCRDKEEDLSSILTPIEIEEGKAYSNMLSVIPEGVSGWENGALLMHDVTEGGVLGAVWELVHGSTLGVDVFEKNILVTDLTRKICKYYNIDPLRLISSGTMIIVCEDGTDMVAKLNQKKIKSSIIGRLKKEGLHVVYIDGTRGPLFPPDVDELFKVIK